MGWRNRPTFIREWKENIDYIMFIDESGNSNPKHVKKCIAENIIIDDQERYLTITGVVIKRENFLEIKDKILVLKKAHWPSEGTFFYNKGKSKPKEKRVCFHSSDIRRRKEPFSFQDIDREKFLNELTFYMESINVTIFSSTIDLLYYYKRYGERAVHPYSQCLNFILERFVKYYLSKNSEACLMLEARGKNEDNFILQYLKNLVDEGTIYVGSDYFSKIKGIYFNPKWCSKSEEKKSFFELEIADLCCYPISQFTIRGRKGVDFESIQKKIYGYPNYWGRGIKKFP